jgi:hypothetical protein
MTGQDKPPPSIGFDNSYARLPIAFLRGLPRPLRQIQSFWRLITRLQTAWGLPIRSAL